MLMRLRTARTILRASFAPKTTTSRIALTVRWADCDVNLHMTNSRYLSAMDVGRWDLMVGSGALAHLMKARMRPTLVEAHVVFKRELRPGTRYEIDTRIVEQRGKAWIAEQLFLVGDRVHAKGEVVSLVVRGGAVVDPSDFVARMIAPRVPVEGFRVVGA